MNAISITRETKEEREEEKKEEKNNNSQWQEPAQPHTITQGGHEIACLLN